MRAYTVHATATTPEPPASEAADAARLPPDAGKKKKPKERAFVQDVMADFDVDLDTLRQAWVDWLFLSRRRKRSSSLITRLRLDFAPVLEGIYSRYSSSRHIHVHKLALPVCVIVYIVLSTYDTLKFPIAQVLPIVYFRVIIVILAAVFIALTRWSRWAKHRALHVFALNFLLVIVGAQITFGTYYNNEDIDGVMSMTLCSLVCFMLVDSSLLWQSLAGFLVACMIVVYNYVHNKHDFPARFAHALLISDVITVAGGVAYLYMMVRLSRKLFLDQVLARLQTHQLERGKDRLNDLLCVILPKSIATRLKAGEQPIADRFDDATVVFAEVLDFDNVVSSSTTLAAVKKLNKLYAKFDHVCEENHVLRVKLIGTTYMAICGVPSIRQHHAELTCNVALSMMETLKAFCEENRVALRLRIGIHCGPLVAGVIGVQKFCYDVWGDTVNTAARMCTHAVAGTIQTTQEVRDKVDFAFEFTELEGNFIKGKGKMVNHILMAKKQFARRTAPVPKLDFTSLNLVLTDHLLDGARLARPHLEAPPAVDDDEANQALMDQRRKDLEDSVPGRVPEGESGSDEDSEDDTTWGKRGAGGGLDAIARPISTTFLMTGHTDDDRDRSSRAGGGGGGALTGSGAPGSSGAGLNRFRENLLRSATLDASAPDSARGVFLTQRATDREDGKVGTIDTQRMQRARNLALAFGFDGVTAAAKEEAENARFAVRTTRCCFTRFVDDSMEATFDERLVQESLGFARLSYLYMFFLILSGFIYDYLSFYNAATVRAVIPQIYTAAELQVPGLAMRHIGITIDLVVGLRAGLGIAPMLIVCALAWSDYAVRLVPYLSMFTIWWMLLIEMICINLTTPTGMLMAASRLVAIIGCGVLLMRGLNVKRLAITSAVGFIINTVGIFMADAAFLWLPIISSYVAPLFIMALILRSRSQVSQRAYFVARMKVARRSKDIAKEQDKVDQMLTNIFPKAIYERIKTGEREIVDNHKAAVVMFADVVGFTKLSMEYTPAEIVETLNEIFSIFDALMVKYNLEKIKTIGDCFVCSAGVSTFNTSPFVNMASCALDMVAAVEQVRTVRGQRIDLRWGIHTGDVISAVVGDKRFVYDVFGDAVQTASLMEASSVAGRVLVSEPVAVVLTRSGFTLKAYKAIQTAAGQPLQTHFLMDRRTKPGPNGSLHNVLESPPSDTDDAVVSSAVTASYTPFSPHSGSALASSRANRPELVDSGAGVSGLATVSLSHINELSARESSMEEGDSGAGLLSREESNE